MDVVIAFQFEAVVEENGLPGPPRVAGPAPHQSKKQDPHQYDGNRNIAVKAVPGVVCSAHVETWSHGGSQWSRGGSLWAVEGLKAFSQIWVFLMRIRICPKAGSGSISQGKGSESKLKA
jgi:hypothetical protein